MTTLGSLFSGLGSLDRAVEIVTGAHTVWQAEAIEYRRAVLAGHWPDAKQHGDVLGFSPPRADLICGGFPCRDISALGSKEGLDGEKSGLWEEYRRIIEETQPEGVFIENVRDLRIRGFDRVLQDLASLGYDAVWKTTQGRDVGRYFKRSRIFLLACAQSEGRRRVPPAWLRRSALRGAYDPHGRDAGLPWAAYGERRKDYDGPKPGLHRSAIGPSRGVVARQRAARVSALGDTVSIPQAVDAYRWCAAQYLKALQSL